MARKQQGPQKGFSVALQFTPCSLCDAFLLSPRGRPRYRTRSIPPRRRGPMKALALVLLSLLACTQAPDRMPAPAPPSAPPPAAVLPGIETFLADVPAALRGK